MELSVTNLISNKLYSYDNNINQNHQLLYLDYMARIYKNKYNIINIEPSQAYAYSGNFYGLLKELKVPEELFLLTLYLNDYTSPDQFNGEKYTIIIPQKPNIPLN